ncbi:hypothetical protein P261_02660 [Lachnospiraceae bacterium TWA4]|nr:hypothetical protein P261_02660 [Lachnospiraceae bacterium TWA4]
MKLRRLQSTDVGIFKSDMQEAFQFGAMEGSYDMEKDEEILPESHIDASLQAKGSAAYVAVDEENHIVGGAIVVIDDYTQHNHLDFLYVKHGVQSKGVGRFIWSELEKLYPDTKVWHTCTPYFEVRNIHFYINICGFHIVEFLNAKHQNPEMPEEFNGLDDGMFVFEKKIH